MPPKNRTPEIDAFLRELNHPLRAEMERVRSIILAANPEITEHIKWKAPSFRFDGEDRVTFNLRAKDGIQLVFHRGAKVKAAKGFEFKDATGLMEWVAADRALVKFKDMQDVKSKKAALTEVVKKWFEANA
jgi:hypothetical protein